MLRIPILSRLSWWEYVQITITLIILLLEWMIRALIKHIPFLSAHLSVDPSHEELYKRKQKKKNGRQDVYDLLAYLGCDWEEHMTVTDDGYILMLQRLQSKEEHHSHQQRNGITLPPSPSTSSNFTNGSHNTTPVGSRRPPILFLPGCMLSSEVWLCHEQADKNLPIKLLQAGYDVWLGNRRGSQYCPKHLNLNSQSEHFWDFSLDDIARYDLPAMIDCVLQETGYKNLTLIGFSQGTAEIFAYLSIINPTRRRQVNLVLALGAVTKPQGMRHAYVRAMVHANPHIFYLLFGRKQMLGSVPFWIRVLPNQLYAVLIKALLQQLFGWQVEHIQEAERMFPHMYTTTSVKTIVHWFQMMQHQSFGMYMEPMELQGVRYPLERIRTPIILFYGQQDTLCDSEYTRNALRNAIVGEHCITTYEHLDFLFADNIDTLVHPIILQELGKLKKK